MSRRTNAGGKAAKAQRRESLARRNASKRTHRRNSSDSLEAQVGRLTRELEEAREIPRAI